MRTTFGACRKDGVRYLSILNNNITLVLSDRNPAQRGWRLPTMIRKFRTRNVPKPRQPKFMSQLGNVQRVEDKARLTYRWVGDFSKNRRRGHSMPPRSRKCINQ